MLLTSAELRIRPLAASRSIVAYQLRSVERGIESMRRILRSNLRPSVIRLYDSLDTLFERSQLGSMQGESPGLEPLSDGFQNWFQGGVEWLGEQFKLKMWRGTMNAVLGAPLFLNRALNVLPDDCLLILGFEGQPGVVRAESEYANQILIEEGAVSLGPEAGEHWLTNRYNLAFKRSKLFETGLFVDTLEVAATWDRLLPLYRAVRRAVGSEAVVMGHFSHAYPDGCSIYFTFAGASAKPKDINDALERYDRILKHALLAVHESGGTIAHHHGVGETKAFGMAREHGAGGRRMLSALKKSFDPQGICNPGKLGIEQLVVRRAAPHDRAHILPREIEAVVGGKNLKNIDGQQIVRPPDERALSALLRVANAKGLSLCTDQMSEEPNRKAVYVDLSKLEGITRISEHSLFVEAETGVYIEQLEKLLNEHGLTLGAVHPRAHQMTLGAALARGLLIRRSIAFGDIHAICFAVRGLLATGDPIETRPVPRSATGPELDRAFVGAWGRFGIITRATLRVARAPTFRTANVYRFEHLTAAVDATRTIIQRGIRPEAARLVVESQGFRLGLELIASTNALLMAQTIFVSSVVHEGHGRMADDDQDLAREGDFKGTVELEARWSSLEALLVSLKLLNPSVRRPWVDFMTPEAVTVVVPFDSFSQKRAILESSKIVDVFEVGTALTPTDYKSHPFHDIATSTAVSLDPSNIFDLIETLG